MAVVDVIDLTVSSPPSAVIVIDDDEETADPVPYGAQETKEKKNRKRRRDERERDRRERRKQEKEDQVDNGSLKHDKYLEEGRHRQGEKRKRVDGARVTRSPRRRENPLPPLFLVDTTAGSSSSVRSQKEPASIEPVPVESAVEFPTDSPEEPTAEPSNEPHLETDLLLPPHVTVAPGDLASLPNEDPPLSPSSEASGIDFLDDDRAVGAPRYFHDTVTQTKLARSRGPCTRCGDDDHDFKSCPNMICITCGARNEHSSRSCPILRFCWNCKAKGHMAKDCPQVRNMNQRELNREDCERCGSWTHHGTNCPSLWRIYTYLTDAEREAVLHNRESKRHLGFDNGGEAYIARDYWCYNCGRSGHLGDDCEVAPNHDRPTDHSAFGSFNELSGPFASPSSAVPKTERPPREWEEGGRFDDGYGFSAENNVGKKGRENAKAKAREAQKQLEADNDETDWFNMNRAGSTNETAKAKPFSRGKSGLPPKPPKPPKPVIHFAKPPLDSGNRSQLPSGPSLRDRIDMSSRQPTEYSHRVSGRREMKGKDRPREESESRRRDERERGYRSRDEPRDRGSRWRGGYER